MLDMETSNDPPHGKTNKIMCAQQRLRARASAQSDHRLLSPHEESFGP